MSQRRSYNSGDFNLDDLFRPEPAAPAGPPGAAPAAPGVPAQQTWGEQPPVQQPPVQQSWTEQPPAQQSWTAQQQSAPAPAAEAPETQYLPPYPTSDPNPGAGPDYGQPSFGGLGAPPGPQAGGQTFGGQQSFGGGPSYGGLGAPPGPQAGGQTFGGQQSFGGGPSYGGLGAPPGPQAGGQSFAGYDAQPAVNEHTTQLGRAEVPRRGGGGPSRKAVIGGLVAVGVIGAILVGVLSSGGDGGKSNKAAAGSTAKATSTGSAAAGSGGTGALSAGAEGQAKAVSNLLSGANSSRQAVIGAVASVNKCDNPGAAQQALSQASAQRKQLLTSLSTLKVDQLPTGPTLVQQLTQAWQASQAADDAYAAWAGDAAGGCDPTKQADNPHRQAGDQSSGQASTAKKAAAATWNAIATQANLPTLGDSQL
ncbi:hypothetical protein [Kitasatospora viridis]|uniref:Uncharacterized protein n=1 Tax=Kitasatospora viridis TaxID=281105 RepID=A0A561UGA4_9ACTN|nr:hypothetical protein [Kitasatospora viridis]TWF98392.1 hypothetical protein FHX73_112200 [Kitasatospora viridis]